MKRQLCEHSYTLTEDLMQFICTFKYEIISERKMSLPNRMVKRQSVFDLHLCKNLKFIIVLSYEIIANEQTNCK